MQEKTGIRVMHLEQKGIKRKQDTSPFRRKIFNHERYDFNYDEHPASYIPKYDSDQQQPSYSYKGTSTNNSQIKQLKKAIRQANELLGHKQQQINRLMKRNQFLQQQNENLKQRLGLKKLLPEYKNTLSPDLNRRNNLLYPQSNQSYFPKHTYQGISSEIPNKMNANTFNKFFPTNQTPIPKNNYQFIQNEISNKANINNFNKFFTNEPSKFNNIVKFFTNEPSKFNNIVIPETPQQHSYKNKYQTPQWNTTQDFRTNTFRNQNQSVDENELKDIVSPLMALAKNKPIRTNQQQPSRQISNDNKKYYIEDSRQYQFSELNSANQFEESKTGFFF